MFTGGSKETTLIFLLLLDQCYKQPSICPSHWYTRGTSKKECLRQYHPRTATGRIVGTNGIVIQIRPRNPRFWLYLQVYV